MSTAAAIGIAVVLLIVGLGGGYVLGSYLAPKSSTTTIDLSETGSSLLYPLMKYYWGPNYTAYDSNVVLSTASTGSGTGQTDAEDSLVNLGASDAYLTSASPSSYGLVPVPVAFSAQLVYYNLPISSLESVHINLNGEILALIYNGTISNWDDSMIQAANPTIASELPDHAIVPIIRKDSSGDTFLFSSLCEMSDKAWTYGAGTSAFSGTNWTEEQGNSGMVDGVNATPYSIAYIGISYEASVAALHDAAVNYAAIGDNQSLSAGQIGVAANYILPTPTTISNDANLALQHLNFAADGLEVSLILGGSYAGPITLTPGAGGTNGSSSLPAYPIVNLEYVFVKTAPSGAAGSVVTSSTLAATVGFLHWAISYGNYNTTGGKSIWIADVHFVPLTPEVIGYDQEEIAQIQA